MKRKKIDLFNERQIVTNMIVSTRFLREIFPVVKSKYFKSSYGKRISKWILEYWEEFKEAPGKQIQDIFYQKTPFIRDEEDVENISEFLSRLSKDYEKISNVKNIDFFIKNAVHYLKLRSLELLKEELETAVLEGNPLKGEQNIANYNKVERSLGIGVSVLRESLPIRIAFLKEEEELFSFSGVLGEVAGRFLRGDLVAFLAASKKGKSWFQLYVAEVAAYFGYKAILFSLEMTEKQLLRRGWCLLTGKPRKEMEIEIPFFEKIEEDQGKKCWRVRTKKEKREGVVVSEIKEKQKQLRRMFRSGDMKIVALPAYSCTVEDIDAYLDNFYYYENYIPDVVIIDYADIVAPSQTMKRDYRHQLDDIWKKLRRMAQERNILVVTASQAGRLAFNRDAAERDIAEDIRKITHVSKMLVINKNQEDEKNGGIRIEQLAERDGRRNYKQVFVLQCLEIGRPYIDSRYDNEVIKE